MHCSPVNVSATGLTAAISPAKAHGLKWQWNGGRTTPTANFSQTKHLKSERSKVILNVCLEYTTVLWRGIWLPPAILALFVRLVWFNNGYYWIACIECFCGFASKFSGASSGVSELAV